MAFHAKNLRGLLQDAGFGELRAVLVAGASLTAVLAALLVESPGTSLILWSLLFVSAILAGYHYRGKGIVAAAVLGSIYLGIMALRASADLGALVPFITMVGLAALASTFRYSVWERVRHREAVEQAPGGAFLLSRDGETILNANPNLAKTLGYAKEDLQGVPASRIWPSAGDRERLLAPAEPGRKTAAIETEFVDRKGAPHWFTLSGLRIDDETVSCRVSEITGYKQAQAALNAERCRLFSVLDALPTCVALQGEDHLVRFANRAFRETFGDPEDGTCSGVLHGSPGSCSPGHEREVFTPGSLQRWEWKHPNGRTYEVHTYPFTDPDGSNLKLQLAFDITERVRAEEALERFAGNLQEKNRELEAMRGELDLVNRDLDEMVRERTADVERLLTRKDEFISQLGHDLKTPLTPLVALIPRILQKEQDPGLRRLLEITANNAVCMRDLVEKTVKLAHVNSPDIELDLEPLNLRTELNGILRNYAVSFKAKAITLDNSVPAGITVRADRVLLGEIFNNLVTDAVNYMQNGTGTITIDAAREEEDVIVAVRDGGTGMTREQLRRTFTESERDGIESPSGLGLAICRRIVERHGGRIWAESAGEGRGSTVLFSLKAADGV